MVDIILARSDRGFWGNDTGRDVDSKYCMAIAPKEENLQPGEGLGPVWHRLVERYPTPTDLGSGLYELMDESGFDNYNVRNLPPGYASISIEHQEEDELRPEGVRATAWTPLTGEDINEVFEAVRKEHESGPPTPRPESL